MGEISFTAKTITENAQSATWVADNGNLTLEAAKGTVVQKGDEGVQLKIGSPPPKAGVNITVLANDKPINSNDIVFITQEPAMPKIAVKAEITDPAIQQVWTRLVIENRNQRNDVDYFPAKTKSGSDNFHLLGNGQTVHFDFGTLFRGGTAKVEVYSGEKGNDGIHNPRLLQSQIFYIRGANPTKAAVKAYLQEKQYLNNYWFLLKMFIHESGSESFAVCRQFYEPVKKKKKVLVKAKKVVNGKEKEVKEWQEQEVVIAEYGPLGTGKQKAGMPLWGTPDGWGLAQIDFNYEKNHRAQMEKDPINKAKMQAIDALGANYLWSWKENIEVEMTFKIPEKVKMSIAHLTGIINKLVKANPKFKIKTHEETEGLITYKTCPSTIPEYAALNAYMPDTAGGANEKSIFDADLIRLNNGGFYISDIAANGTLTISRLRAFDNQSYNEQVGNIAD